MSERLDVCVVSTPAVSVIANGWCSFDRVLLGWAPMQVDRLRSDCGKSYRARLLNARES